MSSSIPGPRRSFRGRLARTMLLILLLLSVGPLLLMGSTGYLRARALLREQIYSLLTAVDKSQGERISYQILTGRTMLARILRSNGLRQALDLALATEDHSDLEFLNARLAVFDTIQTINQPQPYFNQFMVVNLEGRIELATKRDWENQILSDPLYRDQLAGKEASRVALNFTPLYPDAFVIVTAIPYYDSEGNLEATVLGIAESPAVRNLIESTAFYSTNHYFVTRDGNFIGLNPFSDNFNKLIALSPSSEQKQTIQSAINSSARGGVGELLSFQNEPVIAAYSWLPELNAGWVVEISQGIVYNQINSLLAFVVLLVVAMGVLTGIVMWLATRWLFRPLQNLAQTVQLFANGDWGQRAPAERDDEVGLLAYSFNQMADELTTLYRSLEIKVEERTRQVRTNAEASEIAVSSNSLDELLGRVVRLAIDRFEMTYASIFLVDSTGKFAILHEYASFQPSPKDLHGVKHPIDANTLISWVVANNKPRVDSDSMEVFTVNRREDLLRGVRVEAGVPIVLGDQVLGVLNVQSNQMRAIGEDLLSGLQALANQIAPAIRSFHLLEATQINLQETSLLYEASHEIARSENAAQIFQVAARALSKTSYTAALLLPSGEGLRVAFHVPGQTRQQGLVPGRIDLRPAEAELLLSGGMPLVITDAARWRTPSVVLQKFLEQLGLDSAALLPVYRSGRLASVLLLGANQRSSGFKRDFTPSALQPYVNLVELVTTALEKIKALANIQKGLNELQTLGNVSQAISMETDLQTLYRVIYEQIYQVMGDVNFLVAFQNPHTSLVDIPYRIERNSAVSTEPFPLGEGLISELLRRQEPLLLGAGELETSPATGIETSSGEAKSWLGVPLIISGEAVGVMVVQDTERENRFSEDDQRLLSTLAGQVAVAVRNIQLLADSRKQAERERQLFEITSKIRRSTDMQAILKTTAEEIAAALHARSAQIQVQVELPGETPGNGTKGSMSGKAPHNGNRTGKEAEA